MKNKIFLFLILLTVIFYVKVRGLDENEIKNIDINYNVHIQDIGWQGDKKNGEMAGTSGLSKRLEAIRIFSGDFAIEYKTHIQDYGWEDSYKKDGELSGTTGKSKRLEAIKIRLYGNLKDEYDIYYRVHVQNFGWLGWAKNGEAAGSEGYSYRLEAIEIKVVSKDENIDTFDKSFYKKQLYYNTHISNLGWSGYSNDGEVSGNRDEGLEALSIFLSNQAYIGDIEYKSFVEGGSFEEEYRKNGEVSGTTGQSKSINAVRIRLTGEVKEHYDIYYRVYIDKIGYLDWAKNDEITGSEIYKIKTIEIKLLDKNESINSGGNIFCHSNIKYKSFNEDAGWGKFKYDGQMMGSTGKSKMLEAYEIELLKTGGQILYRSFIEGVGWEEYKSSGISGVEGKKIEAISIKLDGEIKDEYDICYRVHVQNIGWLGWTRNGENAGTLGYDYGIEAIEIKLVSKDENIDYDKSFYKRDLSYKTHISNIGWQNDKYDGQVSGTVGQAKSLEALSLKLLNREHEGRVEYKTYIENFGWERDFKSNGNISGTTGRSKKIEAVQIKLGGHISDYYDIYYRVHCQEFGWLGWAKNGEMAGSTGYDKALEAIEIRLVLKGDSLVSSMDAYINTNEGYFLISNYNIEKYLDINGLIKSGEKVVLNDKNELESQVWKIKDYGEYVSIIPINPKLFLNSSLKLTNVLSEDNHWVIKDLGDGYYNIVNGNLYLDYNSGLSLKQKNDNISQKFILTKFEGIKTYRGIDISKWQGNIDFSELIKDKPNFIIMRVGTGRNNYEKDSKFDEYYEKASDYDIPVGAYMYSYALNMSDAVKEADLTIKWLDNKKLDLPVFYDIENVSQTLLGKSVLTKIAETFCDRIISNGYKCGIYANKYFLKDNLDAEALEKKYPIWLAHWTGSNNYEEAETPEFKTDYVQTNFNYWQFSSLGVYRGITENTVDLDFGYDIFD